MFLATLALLDSSGVCPTCGQAPLSVMQKAVGYVTLMGTLKLLGAIALLAGLLFIFWGIIKNLLASKALVEFLLWGGGIGLLILGYRLPHDAQTFALLPASGLIGGGYLYSAIIRDKKIDEVVTAFMLALVWGTIAMFFRSNPVGFIAVGALLTALGFSVLVTPLCYCIGFKDEDSLARGTMAGIVMLALYSALRAFKLDFGHAAVFASGALWLGGLVGFTGLLILSSRHYSDSREAGKYVLMNLVAIALFSLSVFVGGYYDIRQLSTLGVVYGVLLAAEKATDITPEGAIAVGFQLLAVGGLLYGAWHYMHAHASTLSKYIIGLQ